MAALVHRVTRFGLQKQQHIMRVAQTQAVGDAHFFSLPLFGAAFAVDLALGIGTQLSVQPLQFAIADQPPAARTEQQQHHSGEQSRQQRKAQAE
jgi:hypothetical protein